MELLQNSQTVLDAVQLVKEVQMEGCPPISPNPISPRPNPYMLGLGIGLGSGLGIGIGLGMGLGIAVGSNIFANII